MNSWEIALKDIFWYNGYIEFIGKDLYAEDVTIDKYCFINVLWNYAKQQKELRNNILSEYLDDYISMLSEKHGIKIVEHPLSTWGTEEHTIWMLLVGTFGEWGTSIRSGWIENLDELISWIETYLKEDYPMLKLVELDDGKMDSKR